MFSSHEFNVLKDFILSQLDQQTGLPAQGAPLPGKEKEGNNDNSSQAPKPLQLTPGQLLVIAGILTNVLSVFSLLVATDQHVEIVLRGSLKRKTELDKMLDKMGSMPFDDVFKAIMDRVNR